jgi:serine/threonine protein kinase
MLIRTVRSWDVLGNPSFSKNWAEAAWGSSRAREVARGRIVALKRRLSGPESTPQDLERFRIEAMAAARLAHPHFVPVFQVGECDGQPYFTMQYVEGTTLARTLADGPLPAQDAARLLVPVCRAIRYAHDYGVLHRDLKPSNILIDCEGNTYVSDFGLAKRIDVDPTLTPSGASLGTPSYMPPEQAGSSNPGRREPLGPGADVYSLGAILYHTLTGRPPFQAATPIETMQLALEHDPVAPRALHSRALWLGSALPGLTAPRWPDTVRRAAACPRLGFRDRVHQPDLSGRVASQYARAQAGPHVCRDQRHAVQDQGGHPVGGLLPAGSTDVSGCLSHGEVSQIPRSFLGSSRRPASS